MPDIEDATTVDWIQIREQSSTPSTPASGQGRLYAFNDGSLRFVNDAGTTFDVTTINTGLLMSQTSDVTVANTVSETTIISADQGSLTLAANTLQAGEVIRITARGYLSDTGTPNLTIKATLGGSEVCSTGAAALNTSVSNVGWRAVIDITVRTTGASGTVVASGFFEYDDGTVHDMTKTSTTTVDTTGTLALDITAEWGTADASNTITSQIATVEALTI